MRRESLGLVVRESDAPWSGACSEARWTPRRERVAERRVSLRGVMVSDLLSFVFTMVFSANPVAGVWGQWPVQGLGEGRTAALSHVERRLTRR